MTNNKNLLKSILFFTGFLIVAFISMFSPVLKNNLLAKLFLGIISLAITILFYFNYFSLFVPSLFFCINYFLGLLMFLLLQSYEIQLLQVIFLPGILVYIVIICLNKRLKREADWLHRGKIDKVTLLVIIIMIAGSSISLPLWAIMVKKDLGEFFKLIPGLPLPLLFLFGCIFFPVFNALFEEFLARGVLYDGLKKVINNDAVVIILQALIFGLWHYKGFPGGLIGVAMVFLWSCFLGYIRCRSKGMLTPVIAHYFADLCIAVTIYIFYITSQP